MSLKHLESIDSGSQYDFQDKMIYGRNPRSVFLLSHLNSLTIKNAGHFVPIGVIETLPGDDMDINVSSLLRVMPQVVPMYSRERLYVYAFWSRCTDLWSGFDVFMRKGYSGNVVKKIPVLDSSNCLEAASKKVEADSFADYIGLPINAITSDSNDTSKGLLKAGVNAMIPFMAFRVWRDYFCNKNYYINDRIILPDDDSRFRLDDDGNLLSAKDNGKQFFFDIFKEGTSHIYYDVNGNPVFGGFYHDYPYDRFTSSLPFTQRGDTPSLNIQTGNLDFSKVFASVSGSTSTHSAHILALGRTSGETYNDYIMGALYNNGDLDTTSFVRGGDTNGTRTNFYSSSTSASTTDSLRVSGEYSADFTKVFNRAELSGIQFTLNQLRELAVRQTELEKMARTDGSYREFGLTFFGESSKSAQDYRPYYVGGVYKNIVFTEVLQTAGSSVGTTDPDSSSPLGAYAGHGIVGLSGERLGHLHCDDYGYLMFFACIMPDIYYSQGLKKMFTRSLQSDMYLPERSKLGLIPVLNQELFYAGNNGTDQGDDLYLWAYNNPFDELRYCENEIHGKIADPDNKTFFPYTQSRKFNTLVNWGKEFANASDVRKDSFFAPGEDAYSCQFDFDIRAVRELPYKPVPARII